MFSTAFNHSTSPVWKHAPKHHQVISTPSGPHLTCISPAIIGHQGTSFMASWIWWSTQMLQYATSNIIQKPKSVSTRPKSESQNSPFPIPSPVEIISDKAPLKLLPSTTPHPWVPTTRAALHDLLRFREIRELVHVALQQFASPTGKAGSLTALTSQRKIEVEVVLHN